MFLFFVSLENIPAVSGWVVKKSDLELGRMKRKRLRKGGEGGGGPGRFGGPVTNLVPTLSLSRSPPSLRGGTKRRGFVSPRREVGFA